MEKLDPIISEKNLDLICFAKHESQILKGTILVIWRIVYNNDCEILEFWICRYVNNGFLLLFRGLQYPLRG